MFKNFLVLATLASFCGFLYGLFNIFLEVEENACRMTYMFEQPQFSRLAFDANAEFPHYGLYYYREGRFPKNIDEIQLSGAPVIFIPGNGGSYKQVRSLASVALRKAIDNSRNLHLDYFTLDYNEEVSALFGGYLEQQLAFLKHCIRAVLSRYGTPLKVVLIGHSMGGKIAQAVLTDASMVNSINTIFFISSPLDKPVVSFDAALGEFYARSNEFMLSARSAHVVHNETNVCCSLYHPASENRRNVGKASAILDNILLISIGGGNRDLLVPAGLTASKFSDLHAMTSSIPKVWLSCDHLSVVWCLQPVLVISRFLFSILVKDRNRNYVYFNNDKNLRLQNAISFFVKPQNRFKSNEIAFARKSENADIWRDDSKRVFKRDFRNGLRQTYNQMIQLAKFEKFKKLYVEVANLEENDWIYGCSAKLLSTNNNYICEKGISLSHYIQNIPSTGRIRSLAILDLHNLRKTYAHWTHILLRFSPTSKSLYFNVDVHDPSERGIAVKAPRWFALNKKYAINETLQGTSYYKMLIEDLSEPYATVEVNIKAISCVGTSYNVIAKICVPWAPGFNQYHMLNENTSSHIYVNVPNFTPIGYNSTRNPVSVEIYLDPACRYSISYQFSFAGTASRIVLQFYGWLPAHLTAVLLVVLKNQISKFHTREAGKAVKPYTGFFQYTSLYIVTGSRLFKKLLIPIKFLPVMDLVNDSIVVAILIHGISIAASIIASFGLWASLMLHGNLFAKIALRLIKISFLSSSTLVSVLTALPSAFGILAISIALKSCGGIALTLACVFYFLLLSNAYKDYLEDLLWQAATDLLKKAAAKLSTTPTSSSEAPQNATADEHTTQSQNLINAHRSSNNVADKAENLNNNNDNGSIDTLHHKCEGLQNFSFHITMFFLLVIMAALNFGVTLAWAKNYRIKSALPDPSFVPALIVLVCLTILWTLKAPKQFTSFKYGYKLISVVLYVCASASVVYCQDAIYRLNFIIAAAYVIILLQEALSRLWNLYAGVSHD